MRTSCSAWHCKIHGSSASLIALRHARRCPAAGTSRAPGWRTSASCSALSAWPARRRSVASSSAGDTKPSPSWTYTRNVTARGRARPGLFLSFIFVWWRRPACGNASVPGGNGLTRGDRARFKWYSAQATALGGGAQGHLAAGRHRDTGAQGADPGLRRRAGAHRRRGRRRCAAGPARRPRR